MRKLIYVVTEKDWDTDFDSSTVYSNAYLTFMDAMAKVNSILELCKDNAAEFGTGGLGENIIDIYITMMTNEPYGAISLTVTSCYLEDES